MKPKKREKMMRAIHKHCLAACCAEGHCKLYRICNEFRLFGLATDKQIKKVYRKLEETEDEQ